ncbi:MAG: hypothetical protein H0X29_06955 [Parachlamydiaceae bacterium]|nr:hypothetical protein [Parachlamydiaceae bacterium]
MIEPISPITSRSTVDLWEAYAAYEAQASKEAATHPKIDEDAAEEEIVSLWYLSSIKSMQAKDTPSIESTQIQNVECEANIKDESRFQKIRSWLWSWFGGAKDSEISANNLQQEIDPIEKGISTGLSGTPQLLSPDPMNNERLSKAIADINKDLLHRLKDSAEFAEELLQSNSQDMDRLILFHIVSKSLEQKKLKEEAGIQVHEQIFNLQKVNKELHQKHYSILDDINATAKTNKTLHWINIGTTVGIVGSLAVGYATGGVPGVFSFTMPALNILKGGVSSAEGILKYKNDLRTGEMTRINHDVKANRHKINDKVNTTLPYGDEEISHLLKTIRHHLENYSKEARINL